MKRVLGFFLSFLLLACFLCPALAEENKQFETGDKYVFRVLGDGTAEIIGCMDKNRSEVVIPSLVSDRFGKMKDLPVTRIADNAFFDCSALKSVTVPDCVTGIGNKAFYRCGALSEVNLDEGVRSIGEYAFCDCASLKEILLPDSVTELGASAFDGCSALVKIRLSESLTVIPDSLFFFCESLEEVNIPASVTRIDTYAFGSCFALKHITIPDSVQSIGYRAFINCDALEEIIIPEGVTEIGGEAFINCRNVTRISIPDSLEILGQNPFSGCDSLTEIAVSADHPILEVRDGVVFTKPDRRLVYYPRTKADNVYVVPDGTLAIDDFAFFSCSALTCVSLPDSLVSIGEYAFEICSNLQGSDPEEAEKAKAKDDIRIFRIPDGVTRIGGNAFTGCFFMKGISIPDSVKEIGVNPFQRSKLSEIVLSPDHPLLEIIDGALVNKVEKKLIWYPASSEAVEYTIPEGIEIIGECAFSECRNLLRLTVPEGVRIIENHAFSDCDSLEYVELPATVEEMVEDVFFRCDSLAVKTVPGSFSETYCRIRGIPAAE